MTTTVLPPWRSIDRPTRGLLLIGDPHLWSKKPGRRREASFMETVLGKLEQAATIANANDLWPVCLGDLLHDDQDEDTEMLIKLGRVLRRFDRKPVTLVGNHDKDEDQLSERNPLLLLGESDQIDLIDRSGFWGRIVLTHPDGRTQSVAVGGTPYGQALPADVASFVGLAEDPKADPGRSHAALGVDTVVWLTHDDLAFEGAYPGAKPLRLIRGVDLAVNGHMHGTALPHALSEGDHRMAFYNPGNITRMSVDVADHVPSVWSWEPWELATMGSAQGVPVPRLERHPLQHVAAADAFNFEGRHAVAVAEPVLSTGSAFVERLAHDAHLARTDDGVFVRESLMRLIVEHQVPEPPQKILEHLLTQALAGQDAP